jgi:hypothetical protein
MGRFNLRLVGLQTGGFKKPALMEAIQSLKVIRLSSSTERPRSL